MGKDIQLGVLTHHMDRRYWGAGAPVEPRITRITQIIKVLTHQVHRKYLLGTV